MIREEVSRVFPSPGKAIVELMACHKILPEGHKSVAEFCALLEESVVEKKMCDIEYGEHL